MLIIQYQFCFDDILFLGADLGHISFHENFIIFYTAFVVQSLGSIRLCVTSSSLSFTISLSLLKLMSIESVMLSNHLILCHHLLLLLSIFPSISVFPKESALHVRWPKYWSFSFSISPSNAYSGLISLRIDWFYIFAVLGTLKGLLLHHSLKASILWFSDFFMVPFSHPCMATRKTIALTIWIFVSKVMSLLFNMLSGFVIVFPPRRKHLLISWLQSPSGAPEIKSVAVSSFPQFICHEVMGSDAVIFIFLNVGF